MFKCFAEGLERVKGITRKEIIKTYLLTTTVAVILWSAQASAQSSTQPHKQPHGFPTEALNAENLSEWIVEGKFSYKSKILKQSYFYTWTQIASHFKLELREKNMVGEVVATVEGELWAEPDTLQISGSDIGVVNDLVEQNLLTAMAFWLRGLPEDEQAVVKKNGKTLEKLTSSLIANKKWQIDFSDYTEFNHYSFPQKIMMQVEDEDKNKAKQIKIETLRAETSYIASWCQPGADQEVEQEESETVSENTSAELEQFFAQQNEKNKWLNSKDFCEQLALLHGGAIDSKQGLFGPDSMMWELNRYIMPAGFGAGRALLLQVAHPWVTAGIDEHSEVRSNPVERGRRTFTYMYTMIYGSVPQAMNAANEVHQIHKQIQGKLPYDAGRFEKGSEYRANEIEAMIWVNATLWDTLVITYEALERKLTDEEKERFYQETKLFGMLFGIPKEQMPNNWNDFQLYMKYMVRRLEVTDASRQLADDLFDQKNPALMILMPIQKNFTKNTLPPKVAEEYNFETGWFGETFYKTALTGAKIGDRLLLPQFRYNPVYREAKTRIEGKKSGFLIRSSMKTVTKKSTLVN